MNTQLVFLNPLGNNPKYPNDIVIVWDQTKSDIIHTIQLYFNPSIIRVALDYIVVANTQDIAVYQIYNGYYEQQQSDDHNEYEQQ